MVSIENRRLESILNETPQLRSFCRASVALGSFLDRFDCALQFDKKFIFELGATFLPKIGFPSFISQCLAKVQYPHQPSRKRRIASSCGIASSRPLS